MPLREVTMNSRVITRDVTERYREGDFHSSYTVQNELGRGRFAVVRKCTCLDSGRNYAAKFVRKRKMGRSCREDILKEIHILEMSFNHPRLIRLHEVFETTAEVVLVLEFAAGGELHPYCVADKEDAFTEADVVRLVRQILEGVHYLHQNNIVHLDLKPQNILLTAGHPCLGDIKLIDFGIARLLHSGEVVRDIVGTPEFVAPEVLNYEPITLATDMWSIGVLVYVMLTGISPFAGDDKQETFLNISQVNLDFPGEFFEGISAGAIELIQRVCVKEPEKRLTAEECLNHPWLQDNGNEKTVKSLFRQTSNENNNGPAPGTDDGDKKGEEKEEEEAAMVDNACPCPTPTPAPAVAPCIGNGQPHTPALILSNCPEEGCTTQSAVSVAVTATALTVRTAGPDSDSPDGRSPRDSDRRGAGSEDAGLPEAHPGPTDSSESPGGRRSPFHSPSLPRRALLKSKDALPKDLNHPKRICIQVS